ncbi:MAG: STAS domain-containing protein [Pseudomonadota bacterium]
MTERLELPAKLDTAAAGELITALRSRQGGDLVLDASSLQQIGGLCVQAIIVAANDWQDSGHALRFENVSDEVADQLRLFGTSPSVVIEGDIR